MDKVLKNVIIFAGIILIIAAVSMVIVFSGNSDSNKLNTANSDDVTLGSNSEDTTIEMGNVQNVKVKVSGGTYIMTPSTVQKDIPVRMEFDLATTKGCARSVVIPEFGVKKYLSQGDNVITFTPTKTGEIEIACSMYMYTGKFTVI